MPLTQTGSGPQAEDANCWPDWYRAIMKERELSVKAFAQGIEQTLRLFLAGLGYAKIARSATYSPYRIVE